jgi:hypothetical protein
MYPNTNEVCELGVYVTVKTTQAYQQGDANQYPHSS